QANSELRTFNTELRSLTTEQDRLLRDNEKINKRLSEIEAMFVQMDSSTCPTCHQHWDDSSEHRRELEKEWVDLVAKKQANEQRLTDIEPENDEIQTSIRVCNDRLAKLSEELTEIKAIQAELK